MTNNTAGPQLSAYLLQLERALYLLSTAQAGVSVAVEQVDDVSVSRHGKTEQQEQNKNTISKDREILGDRSKALWRTLQIWLDQRRRGGSACDRYLLVTNTTPSTSIASLIRGLPDNPEKVDDLLKALRAEGARKSTAKVQKIIEDVLRSTDDDLKNILSRTEIVDDFSFARSREIIANGLAIHPQSDRDAIVDGLLGWLAQALRSMWQSGAPGIVSREACIRQCRALEEIQARHRLLPRPASDVIVRDNDRELNLSRPFVNHLLRISAEEEDVLQAIDHFVQFNIEKHRLTANGDIPLREWSDRGRRLRERWANIVRIARRRNKDAPKDELGCRILEDTTYTHCEPLYGEPCTELYMTSGHYHRLVDDDEVWWDPTYESGQ
jgi:hypothetical protein